MWSGSPIPHPGLDLHGPGCVWLEESVYHLAVRGWGQGAPALGIGASGSWNKDSRLLLLSPPNSGSHPERDMLSCQSPSPRADTFCFKIVGFFNF